MPTISVVVPVYKVESYLHCCIDSILSQTHSDFELILVDDGSPDCCGLICDAYAELDDRIHVIHQRNGGLSAARNSGIDWAFANGDREWITFIDSDDWVSGDYLCDLYRSAMENGVDCAICAHADVYRSTDVDLDGCYEETLLPPDQLFGNGYLSANNISAICAWAKLYKLMIFDEIRYPYGKLNEDRFTTHRLLFRCEKVSISTKKLYYYNQTGLSIMRSDWSPRKMDDLDAYEEQIRFFRDRGCRNAFEDAIRGYFFSLAQQLNDTAGDATLKGYYEILRSRLKYALKEYGGYAKINLWRTPEMYHHIYPLTSRVLIKMRLLRR